MAIRDVRRTMWIQVGMVGADVTRLQIKELHVSQPPCSQTEQGAKSGELYSVTDQRAVSSDYPSKWQTSSRLPELGNRR